MWQYSLLAFNLENTMRRWINLLAAVPMLISVVACSQHNGAAAVPVEPKTIKLSQAVDEIVQALAPKRASVGALSPYWTPRAGLDICTADAQLLLSAVGKTTDNGGISVGADVTPVTAKVDLRRENDLTNTRQSTLTLHFVSPACNPSGTLGTTHPEQINTLLRMNQLNRDDPGR